MLRAALHYLEASGREYEIIVVDDGSKDNTLRILQDFSAKYPRVKVVDQGKNKGKGAAVKAGMLAAQHELLIFSDADGSTPIEEIERLEKEIVEGVDVVIGSRAIAREGVVVETVLHRRILGRVFNTAVNLLLLPQFKDTQCGFKLFKREVAQDIFNLQRSERFSFDCEILLIALKRGYKVSEVGVNWNNVAGSKVNLIADSLKMLRDLVVFRMWHAGVERK